MSLPSMTLLFPGQGTEAVGMSTGWTEDEVWNATLEAAERHCGYPLRKLMAEGPLEDLRFQRHAPCAVLAHSVALYRAHRGVGMELPAAATGHSMGFYSALVAAEVVPLEAGLDLLRTVEDLSEAAFGPGTMGMAFVIGLGEAELHAELALHPDLALSNRNGKAQFTVSGPQDALRAFVGEVEGRALKCGPLPVQHPLHGPHMVALMPAITRQMAQIRPRTPVFPLISHFDGRLLPTADAAWDEGLASVALPVDWLKVVERLKAIGAPLAECGYGKQLTGLTGWADRELRVKSLQVK